MKELKWTVEEPGDPMSSINATLEKKCHFGTSQWIHFTIPPHVGMLPNPSSYFQTEFYTTRLSPAREKTEHCEYAFIRLPMTWTIEAAKKLCQEIANANYCEN